MEGVSETEDEIGEEEGEEGSIGIGIAVSAGDLVHWRWPIAMWTKMRAPNKGPHLKDYISISAK